jgi:hypothetical protein
MRAINFRITVASLFFITAVAGVAQTPANAPAQPVVVSVCGATKATPTHVDVHHGERWTIEVIGSSPSCVGGTHSDSRLRECDRPDCAMWADGKRISPVTPRGWERWYVRPFAFLKRVRSAHWYELTGAVGCPFQQTFAIGRRRTVTIASDGELFLFANDAPRRYGNNTGSLRVRIAPAD